MVDSPFVSFAQNREDVVLWRALKHVERGRYVDVGANHPTNDSITRAFYDRGWRGITVEPVPEFTDLHRRERPEDILIDTVVSASSGEELTLQVVEGTGLSTLVDTVGAEHAQAGFAMHELAVTSRTLDDVLAEAGWADLDIHFMTIDVEGAEPDVLRGLDLRTWRPWVLVIESTQPNSTEQSYSAWESMVTGAGYQFCLFDGLSRFYVAAEHAQALAAALSYPACVIDGYLTGAEHRLLGELDAARRDRDAVAGRLRQVTDDAVRWRSVALTRWARTVASPAVDVEHLHEAVRHLNQEIEAIHQTVSWRVTAPLRAVRARQRSTGHDE